VLWASECDATTDGQESMLADELERQTWGSRACGGRSLLTTRTRRSARRSSARSTRPARR
jgi:hypothetical protein